MKFVKFTQTDNNGPVYVNPCQVVKVSPTRVAGTASVTLRNGWLVHVHGDAAAVAQALESVKLLPDAPGPYTVELTRITTHVDMYSAADRICPDITHTAIEVVVDDVLCVTMGAFTGSALYRDGRAVAPGLEAPVELAEPPDAVAAKLEGRE